MQAVNGSLLNGVYEGRAVPHTVFVGNTLSATCCAKGYREPTISINGNAVQAVNGSLLNGVNEGCATRNVNTSNVSAGMMMTTSCNASLNESVTCTKTGLSGEIVPQQAVRDLPQISAFTKIRACPYFAQTPPPSPPPTKYGQVGPLSECP